MEFSTEIVLLLSVLIFIVAALYSSVGHGGASGYLAVLSFFALSPSLMSTTALVLNVLVAGVGLVHFVRAGHFSAKASLPFVFLSVPAAFLGGYAQVSERVYFLLLSAVLAFAAYRMYSAGRVQSSEERVDRPSAPIAVASGAGIGFLSGVVGVGGGIFLSPIMILLQWASTKQTAAVSAFFIFVNSLAGLAGRGFRGGWEIGTIWPFVFFAFAGGFLGSFQGANKLTGPTLRKILALVLSIASVKLIILALQS